MSAGQKMANKNGNITSRTKFVGTRLSHKMVAGLNQAAKREGITMTELVKRGVERELERVLSNGGEDAAIAVG